MHIVIRLPVEQAGHIEPISESLKVVKLVLEHKAMQIAANADV